MECEDKNSEYSDSSSHDSFKYKLDLLDMKRDNPLKQILPELIAKIHTSVLHRLMKK